MDYGKISLCTLIIFYINASDRSSISSEEIREWDELIDPSRDRAESADDNEPIALSLLIPTSPRIRIRIFLPEILQFIENFDLYRKELSELSVEELRPRQRIIKFMGRQTEREFLFISPLSFAISRFAYTENTLREIIYFFNEHNIYFDSSALFSAIQQLSFHTQCLNANLIEMILNESSAHINDQNVYENDSEYDDDDIAGYSALNLFISYLVYSNIPIDTENILKVFEILCLHGGKSEYIENHKKCLFRDNPFSQLYRKHTLLAIKMLEIYNSYYAHEARMEWDAMHKTT